MAAVSVLFHWNLSEGTVWCLWICARGHHIKPWLWYMLKYQWLLLFSCKFEHLDAKIVEHRTIEHFRLFKKQFTECGKKVWGRKKNWMFDVRQFMFCCVECVQTNLKLVMNKVQISKQSKKYDNAFVSETLGFQRSQNNVQIVSFLEPFSFLKNSVACWFTDPRCKRAYISFSMWGFIG